MVDFLINDNGELIIQNGDFATGTSDGQQQKLLLICEKGSIKEYPVTGVGAFRFLEGEDAAELLRQINIQFTGDGMNVNSLKVENGKINVDATY